MLLSNAAISAVSAAFLASLVEVGRSLHHYPGGRNCSGVAPSGSGHNCRINRFVGDGGVPSGPALSQIPLQSMRIAIGLLLLLFGLRWLRKAILRYAGVISLLTKSAALLPRRRNSRKMSVDRTGD